MLARFRLFVHPAAARAVLCAAALAALPFAAPALAQPSAGGDPLPRFAEAVCPGIVGFRQDFAEYMVGRIRANAAALGLRGADETTCEPNVLVVAVGDSQAFLERLRAERGFLFREVGRDEKRELLDSASGPARALLRVRVRTRDGIPVSRQDDLSNVPQALAWSAHSRIFVPTQNDIVAALVVFDRDAVQGLTADQLADYASFRAFSHALPAAGSPSIVALFEDRAERPAGLTDFDRAFLGRLYDGLPNMPATSRLAGIDEATGRVAGEPASRAEE